jgi:hypothetical protein
MEFVSPDPKAMVRAANVRATLDAFQLRPSIGQRLIEKHQLALEDLRPERFIFVQRWLDALKEIQETIGSNLLHRVGTAILQNAEFPPQFDSIDTVFAHMDDIYYANHTGDVGHYRVTRRPSGGWEIRCETPYPRHFERGAVEGVCRHAKFTGGKGYHVEFIDGPPGGDLTCTLIVRPA